jgi:RimK family alpha-L-glutamate ligase
LTKTPSVFLLCNWYKSSLTGKLRRAAESLNVEFGAAMYRDLRFDARNGPVRIDTGPGTKDVTGHTHYIFRGSIGIHHIKNAVITSVLGKAAVLNQSAYEQNVGYYNKLVQLVRLSQAGVPVIPTSLTNDQSEFDAAIAKRLNASAKAFIKPVAGTAGVGCHMIDADMPAVADTPLNISQTFVQDYMPIKEDYRVLILGDRVLGVMKRTMVDGKLVSNVAQGAATSAVTLGQEILNVARLAAKTMGLEFAGVDILLNDGKPYVIEVNIQPGFSGFEDATGVNVAREIIQHLIAKPIPKPFDPTNWMPFHSPQ